MRTRTYGCIVHERDSERRELVELERPPRIGEELTIAGMAVVVTDFVPGTRGFEELRGYSGVVVCSADLTHRIDPRREQSR
jgi:hypothetical protein